MLHCLSLIRYRTLATLGAVGCALLVAGCGTTHDAERYHSSRETTQADARRQAQGGRGSVAPSQLQVGFGQDEQQEKDARRQQEQEAESDEQQADEEGQAAHTPPRPLLEARTFLGTMPCLTDDANCPPSRVTLTFAPSGEWRSRSEPLGTGSQTPITQQGCWEVTHEDPLRIILRTRNDGSRAAFEFANDNVLRVTRFNGVQPTLDYHLTRQPDIDAIDELADKSALDCSNS